MKTAPHIILTIVLSSCYLSEELPPDQEIWDYALPSETGLNDQLLHNLDSSITESRYGNINGMIITKSNNLIFENYYNTYSRSRTTNIGRGTLAISTLVMGFLMEDGLINDLNTPIYQYLPEYEAIFNDSPKKQDITIMHLLQNNSGLIWNESLINTQRSESDLYRMKLSNDWVAYILSKPLEANPGLRKVLNSASGVILARIFQNQLEDRRLEEYIHQKLFDPLGIQNYTWQIDPSGTLNGATGLDLSTMDYAKIGYIILKEGKWTNNQRVVDRNWILDLTTVWTSYDPDYSFGFGWWLYSDSFLNTYLPSINSVPFLSGESGSTLYVVPDEEMIICIMSDNYFFNSHYNPSLSIFLKSLESIEQPQIN